MVARMPLPVLESGPMKNLSCSIAHPVDFRDAVDVEHRVFASQIGAGR